MLPYAASIRVCVCTGYFLGVLDFRVIALWQQCLVFDSTKIHPFKTTSIFSLQTVINKLQMVAFSSQMYYFESLPTNHLFALSIQQRVLHYLILRYYRL